ncbi:MAG: metal-dependent hydrolase [Cardiobacteriaceae bacterium]|nr:metal-dependent hydrolase [Cardiobacteriaceae bacterium]
MDSLTQAVLGAATYSAVMGKHQGRKALLIGAALGTLPDLDVLIRYADPISQMTYHRGASHSLWILTAFAWGLAFLWHKWKKPSYSTKRFGLAIWLALITHPLIDAMTMYGTQLWYPFTPPPTSWATIFIIDPLYTLPMLLACGYYLFQPSQSSNKALWLSILWGCAYFLWGFVGKSVHENRVRESLEENGIRVERIISNPTPFNTILWRVVAEDGQDNLYEAYSSWFDQQAPKFRKIPKNTHLRRDIWDKALLLQRLHWFTDGWLAYEMHGEELVVKDVRMSYLGISVGFEFVVGLDHRDHWHIITPKRFGTRQPLPEAWFSRLWQRMMGNQQVFAEELGLSS